MIFKQIVLASFALTLLNGTAFAITDYSAMSTEEMAARRGAMQNYTVEERNAFQHEWQKRLKQMSPEEHRKYMRGQGPENRQQNLEQNKEQAQERSRERLQENMPQDKGGMMGGGRPGGGGMGGGGRGR